MSLPPGSRMPAETAPHARTLMAWPTDVRRSSLWRDTLDDARHDYASVARAIARFEPVTMIANPTEADDAMRRCGAAVEVVAMAIDDSWLRDTGPIVVVAPDRSRHAVHFRFNSWGEKYRPYDQDATIGARIAERLGLPVHEAPLVLEGGSIAVDGAGTLVTTERCLLNPNRNGGRTREDIETALRCWLGGEQIVWLADAIVEDAGTDGHVDNVVASFGPGRFLLQGCDDPRNPNHAVASDNRARLIAAGIDVVEIPVLPYAEVGGERRPVPYVNFCLANGALIVPVTGHDADDDALATIGACFPGREVVGVPGAVLAYGGGGVHCITQPVPA